MKDKRFQFGVIVTASWLGVMVGIAIIGTRPEKLNEWGDFFAGFFAPLAFLWLVIGYLQQGEELRQSSQALRLQAAELKNSVEQQSQLVDVSRRQLEQETFALQEERQRRINELRPRFLLSHSGYSGTNGQFNVQLNVQNEGGTSVDTVVSVEQPEGKLSVLDHVLVKRGDRANPVVRLTGEGIWHGEIAWQDEGGNRGRELFALRMTGGTLLFDQPRAAEPSKMIFTDKG